MMDSGNMVPAREHQRNRIRSNLGSVRHVAAQLGVSPTTVQKWRHRDDTKDRCKPATYLLSSAIESTIIAFRRQSLLSLDDCFYVLKRAFPALTRSSLHRCFVRHGVSRTPLPHRMFLAGVRDYNRVGAVHLCIVRMMLSDGPASLIFGIDAVTKCAAAEVLRCDSDRILPEFMDYLRLNMPFPIHTLLINADEWRALGLDCEASGGGRLGNEYHYLDRRVVLIPNPDVGSCSDGQQRSDFMELTPRNMEKQKVVVANNLARYNRKTRLKCLGGSSPFDYARAIGL